MLTIKTAAKKKYFLLKTANTTCEVTKVENADFDKAVEYVKNAFSDCADFNSRNLVYCGTKRGVLFNIGSYTDRDYISQSIMFPVMRMKNVPSSAEDIFGVIYSSELLTVGDENDACTKLLSGFAVLMLELKSGFCILGCMVRRTAQRSVGEPDSEKVLKGPREGFIENAEDNLALLRKRLKTTCFKSLRMTAGELTGTTIYLCYIDGVAKKETVDRIKRVLENIRLPSVLDSGYIEHYLKKGRISLFPNAGSSEKPDVVAAKLLEGRVGIICEGSPAVVTAPYLFIEALQSAEDYLKGGFYASFMRILRFASLMISLYLPAVYLSTVEHHTSVLPYKLFKAVINLRRDVPFEVAGELFVILFIFELIREVGVRKPGAVGDSVGIVAGLILGDAAISAGLASAPVIMVCSLTAVCTFIVPPFMNGLVLLRFANIILADFLGFPGVVVSLCFLLCALCTKESFGVPYLLPFSPLGVGGLCDSLTVLPEKALKHVKNSIYPPREE